MYAVQPRAVRLTAVRVEVAGLAARLRDRRATIECMSWLPPKPRVGCTMDDALDGENARNYTALEKLWK